MKTIYTILFLSLSLNFSFAQAINSSKADKIDQLIKVLGSEEQYQSFINVGLDNLVAKYGPQLAETDKQILREEALNLVKTFMENDMKNIYDKYLTEQELDDLIAFYSSETGRRFRQVQPMISQEINQVMINKYMTEFKEVIAKRLTSK